MRLDWTHSGRHREAKQSEHNGLSGLRHDILSHSHVFLKTELTPEISGYNPKRMLSAPDERIIFQPFVVFGIRNGRPNVVSLLTLLGYVCSWRIFPLQPYSKMERFQVTSAGCQSTILNLGPASTSPTC